VLSTSTSEMGFDHGCAVATPEVRPVAVSRVKLPVQRATTNVELPFRLDDRHLFDEMLDIGPWHVRIRAAVHDTRPSGGAVDLAHHHTVEAEVLVVIDD
jgi:hypothetical protein